MKITLAMAVFAPALLALPAFAETATLKIPENLKPPAGNVAFMKGQAIGTQNYVCLPTANGLAWTFHSPQATLFVSHRFINTEVHKQITTHYLSPNPGENGTPRATWQSSLDSSAVWGRAIANSTDSNYVAPGAIPWLLLEVVGKRDGLNGSNLMGWTTFIQRVNTAGGVAPATGCSEAAQVGSTVMVPYVTDYVFYRAEQ
ncbi:MAG: DUF3455 domain-containing protein [Acidobacteria bacterium]|nr:DUF3455 domain-containing protein [Acidobacteriota bacterium]